MSGSLFFTECRQIAKSITYVVFVALLVLFAYTQILSEFKKVEKPLEGQKSYGMKYEEIPGIIMPNATKELYSEFCSNSYTAYPLGFYKNVKLNDEKQNEMAGILSRLTGLSETDLLTSANIENKSMTFNTDNMDKDKSGNFKVTNSEGSRKPETPAGLDVTTGDSITYELFRRMMEQADRLIGGGSKYNGVYLIRFGEVPKTYQDALSEYSGIVKKDRITGAFARLFCDYLGIILAIFPVFIAVASGMKDRRTRMQDLIYSRKASSFKIVIARYSAMVALMFLPVLLMAVYATIKVMEGHSGMDIDVTAFVKYSLIWLIPTLMVSTAVGTFLTELTKTPIAIAVQGFWWFTGLFAGMKHIDGGYGASLVLRHNTVGNTQVYLENLNTLLINRICYTLLAVLLVLSTVFIYELKRRGRLNVFGSFMGILPNRKSESAA